MSRGVRVRDDDARVRGDRGARGDRDARAV